MAMMLLAFQHDAPVKPATPTEPTCPLCHGPLTETRGQARCTRCQFTFCQECDGSPVRGEE